MRTKANHSIADLPQGKVTVALALVENWKQLWGTLGPERVAQCMVIVDEQVTSLAAAHHGFISVLRGGVYEVLFHTAKDAVMWAVELQEHLFAAAWPDDLFNYYPDARAMPKDKPVFRGLRLSTSLITGDVLTLDFGLKYTGACLETVRKLGETLHGGQVVCVASVSAALKGSGLGFKSLGDHHIPGINEPLSLVQIIPKSILSLRFFPAIKYLFVFFFFLLFFLTILFFFFFSSAGPRRRPRAGSRRTWARRSWPTPSPLPNGW